MTSTLLLLRSYSLPLISQNPAESVLGKSNCGLGHLQIAKGFRVLSSSKMMPASVAEQLENLQKKSFIELHSNGNSDGPMLVFIHGWPDSPDLWEKQVSTFEKDYHCVSLTLPNYGDIVVTHEICDFEAVANGMKETLDRFIEKQNCQEQEKILCAHDWGCIYGYIMDKNSPGFFSKMISMDVGPTVSPTLKETGLIILYQGLLILAFLIGGFVGDTLARAVAKYMVHAPVAINTQTLFAKLSNAFHVWRPKSSAILFRLLDATITGNKSSLKSRTNQFRSLVFSAQA